MIQQEKPQFSSRNIPYKFGNNYLSPSYIHHNKNINTTSPSFLVDQASKIALATDSSIVENHRLSPDQSVATFLVVALVVELIPCHHSTVTGSSGWKAVQSLQHGRAQIHFWKSTSGKRNVLLSWALVSRTRARPLAFHLHTGLLRSGTRIMKVSLCCSRLYRSINVAGCREVSLPLISTSLPPLQRAQKTTRTYMIPSWLSARREGLNMYVFPCEWTAGAVQLWFYVFFSTVTGMWR